MKLLHEDDKTLRFDNGRVLAKGGLSPGYVEELRQKYAGGGDVQDAATPVNVDAPVRVSGGNEGYSRAESSRPQQSAGTSGVFQTSNGPVQRHIPHGSPPPRRMAGGGDVAEEIASNAEAPPSDYVSQPGATTTIAPDGTVSIAHAPPRMDPRMILPDSALPRPRNVTGAAEADERRKVAAAVEGQLGQMGVKPPINPNAPMDLNPGVPPPPRPIVFNPAGKAAPDQPKKPPPAGPRGPDELANQEGIIQDASRQQQDIARQQGDVAQQSANEQGNAASQALLNSYGVEAGRQDIIARQNAELARRGAAIQGAIDEYSHATVDPQRFWGSRTGWQKGLAIVGTIFGGIGQGLVGGNNPALEMIEGNISRDIDAQKTNIEKLGKNIGHQTQLYGIMKDKFGSELAANTATGAAMREQYALQCDMLAKKYEGTQQGLQYAATAQGLRQKTAQEMATLAQSEKARAMQYGFESKKLELEEEKVRLMGGKGPELAAKAGIDVLDDLQKSFSALGTGDVLKAPFPGATRYNEYKDKARAASETIARALGGGKARDADVKRIQELLPSAAESRERGLAKLMQLRQQINEGKLFPIAAPGGAGE